MVSAGGAGVELWDARIISDGRGVGELMVGRGEWVRCVAGDAAQGGYVFGGTSGGVVLIWDVRMGGVVAKVGMHAGTVWEVGVVNCSKAGLLLSGGEDGRVWLMDFAAAAGRSDSSNTMQEDGFWNAELAQSDLRDVGEGGLGGLGVNGVHAHPNADLFGYTMDSGCVAFGSLYS